MAVRRLLAALILLSLAACTKPVPVVLAAGEYRLDDYGLSLRLPAGWRVQERAGGLRWQARPEEAGQPVRGVYFLIDRDAARAAQEGFPETAPTLDSYVARSEELASRDSLRYRIAAGGPLSLDGIAAIWHERAYASYTMQRRSYAVMAVRDRYGYLLVGSAPDADYRRWEPAFRAIVNSLHWQASGS